MTKLEKNWDVERNILKKEDIADKMSKIVMKYLGDCWNISLKRNGVFFRELHIDTSIQMYKGDDILLINYGELPYHLVRGYEVHNACAIEVCLYKRVGTNTLTDSSGDVLENHTYFSIDKEGTAWTDSLDFARDCHKKFMERMFVNDRTVHVMKPNKRMLNITKRHYGYKRLKVEDIRCLKRVIYHYTGDDEPIYSEYSLEFLDYKKDAIKKYIKYRD